jgi:hypothetical protein
MQGSRSPSLASGERAAQGGCAPNKLHPPRGLVGNGDRIERSPLLGAIRWGLARPSGNQPLHAPRNCVVVVRLVRIGPCSRRSIT